MISGGYSGGKMPCESCAVQFSVFKRKRVCCECERYYCSGCLRRGGGAMCAPCRVLSTRPLARATIAHLKVRDLQCFLQRQNVSTRGCVEKDELVSLCVSHVNSAAYRRRGARPAGAFSSLKGLTNNINDLLNSAFDLRTAAPQPAPPPPQPPPSHNNAQTRSCFNAAHAHRPAAPPAPSGGPPQTQPQPERFTTTPGGERDIHVPVPETRAPGSASSGESPGSDVIESADCFEIEDLDDAGWEFVTRPADPLPNDSDVLLSTTVGAAYRRDSNHHTQPPAETRQPSHRQHTGTRQTTDSRQPSHLQFFQPTLLSPDSGQPADLSPDSRQPDLWSPDVRQSADLQSPGVRQPADLQSPGVRQPADLQSPGVSRPAESRYSDAERIPARGSRATSSRDHLMPGHARDNLSPGLSPARASSELELRGGGADSSLSDTGSLKDEPCVHRGPDSNSASPRHVTLDEMRQASDLDALNVKQLKELLTRNRVEYRGCIERKDLLERAKMLWRDHAQYKDEIDTLPLEECCKICMAAPLECVLLECGHIAACTGCSKQLAECPICRQYVVRAVRFFRS